MSQKVLHAIKYKDSPELATYLGNAYGTLLRNLGNPLAHIDALVPVPLHPKKMTIRGYNQSQALAEGLQQALEIPILQGLVRTQHSLSQTKKNRMERLEVVNQIFQAQENVKGKNVLLIDDVMTTGATLIACMNSLVEQGAKRVDVFVLAAGR
ncbi:ComF family protein [Nitritalea halalkaliphila]|nr:phosphoribosyltransferase family protein [Nitritalea halalkaliphila]